MIIINKVLTTNINTKPMDIGVDNPIKTSLRQFHIFHCTNIETMYREIERQPRKWVASVFAHNIEEAYRKAQNDAEGSEYLLYDVRSTTVGDLIQDNLGFYMVCANEFRFICKNEDPF